MDEIKGVFDVEFTTGETRNIDIKVNITNPNAIPLYLIDSDGRLYNWGNIVSIRKASKWTKT